MSETRRYGNFSWENFATTVLDPSDDLTFWYVGNYLKTGSATPATRIAAVRVP